VAHPYISLAVALHASITICLASKLESLNGQFGIKPNMAGQVITGATFIRFSKSIYRHPGGTCFSFLGALFGVQKPY